MVSFISSYFLLTISLLISISDLATPVATKVGKYYIYPWPNELHDVYPPPNATLHSESTYSHSFYPNDGIGELLNGPIGLFQTWQFALYKNIMQRLRVSSHRTFDPEEATAFIIPFDCGVHSYIDHRHGRKRLGSPHGWKAIQLLENSPYMKRHHGHDHFVVFSITLYQMIGIGVKMFYQNICFNCTTLVIESSPAFVPALTGWPFKQYWHAVPYPASFHWWEGIKQLPWATTPAGSSATSLNSSGIASARISTVNGPVNGKKSRDIFVFFMGSLRTATVSANRFRKRLHSHCLAANTSTTTAKSQALSQYAAICQWMTVAHACNALVHPSSASTPSASNTDHPSSFSHSTSRDDHEKTEGVAWYLRSVFCPAPVGDSLTRKSLFDSLLGGCIPVIFDPLSLSQYLWHLSAQDREDISVYIPRDRLVTNDSANFVLDFLTHISTEEIERKQQAIASLAPRLQYSLVPARYRREIDEIERSIGDNANNAKNIVAPRWDPPFDDAVSVIIQHVVSDDTSAMSSNNRSSTALAPHLLRERCLHNNGVVQDGVVFSRGLAWHRLRQLCQTVGIIIQLKDGSFVDTYAKADGSKKAPS